MVLRKVLFMWSSMPIFSFIGYTLTELFSKPDNWRQIYKQTSLHTSNDVLRRKNISTKLFNILGHNKAVKYPFDVLFLKKYRSSTWGEAYFLRHIIWGIFFWSRVFLIKNNSQGTENTKLPLLRSVMCSI